jgi:hypothetical protein
VADDSGDGYADGVDWFCLRGGKRFDPRGEQFHQFAAGEAHERIHLVDVDGIAERLAGEALVLKSSGYDVFRDYDADGGGH